MQTKRDWVWARVAPMLFTVVVGGASVAACGGSGMGGGAPDGGGAMADGGTPDAAPSTHQPFPLLTAHGGGLLAHVQLVTITYPGYANKAGVEDFGDYIVTSDWYHTVGAEYGVMAGTHLAKFVLPDPPTATVCSTDLEALIQTHITDGTLPKPVGADNQLLYMLYVPSTVMLCPDLMAEYGHHAAAVSGGVNFAYAIILDDASGLGTTTSTAAHELIEAATDPYDPPKDGYWLDPPDTSHWTASWGLEVGDLCDYEDVIVVDGHTVQRSWSNAAAAAGKNPCIPEVPDDSWQSVDVSPETVPTVAAGASVTFTLTGWATSPTADWSLALLAPDSVDLDPSTLNATFSKTTMNIGQQVTLTLTVPAGTPSGKLGGVYVASGDHQRIMPVAFVVK